MILKESGVGHADMCGTSETDVETCTVNCGSLNDGLEETAEASAVNNVVVANIHGVIYRYEYVGDEEDLKGKSYVGTTPDEKTRRQSWNNWSNAYAGKKIKDARARTKPKDWNYEVLKEQSFATPDDYEKWAEQYEGKYIEKYNSYENGFNGNKGGCGRGDVSPEERQRISEQHKEMRHTEETKELIAQKLKGRIPSQETRDKISQKLTGREFTPEHKENLSKSMKKKYENGGYPEKATEGAAKWREENGGNWWKGKHLPQSAIDKRSQSMREKGNCVKVTDSDGNVTCYPCQTDAAKATGLKDGSVKYALDNNGLHAKSGNRFERINGDDYNKWKNQKN